MESSTSLATTLESFVTDVTSSISSADVLAVYGKALLAGVGIFLVVWGARKIVNTFISALNGHIGV